MRINLNVKNVLNFLFELALHLFGIDSNCYYTSMLGSNLQNALQLLAPLPVPNDLDLDLQPPS